MGTLRLKPSRHESNAVTISYPEQMYSDADSSSMATIRVNSELEKGWLCIGGFFDNLPAYKNVSGFTVNINIYSNGLTGSVFLGNVVKDGDKLTLTPLGTPIDLQNPHYTNTTETFPVFNRYTFEDLKAMDNVCLCFTQLKDIDTTGSGFLWVSGVDIELSCSFYNRVECGEKTLIDLTSDTVTASDVVSGVTFHLPDGSYGVGTFSPVMNTITEIPDRYSLCIEFQGLTKEPAMFAVIAKEDVTLSTRRTILSVVADGTSVYAVTGHKSGSNAVAYKTGSDVSWSYSNGVLRVSSDSRNTAGEFDWQTFYVLVYC